LNRLKPYYPEEAGKAFQLTTWTTRSRDLNMVDVEPFTWTHLGQGMEEITAYSTWAALELWILRKQRDRCVMIGIWKNYLLLGKYDRVAIRLTQSNPRRNSFSENVPFCPLEVKYMKVVSESDLFPRWSSPDRIRSDQTRPDQTRRDPSPRLASNWSRAFDPRANRIE
jgi:hypothetical protein